MNWKSPAWPRVKKAMMIVFLDIRGVIHVDWVLKGQTVNQTYHLQVLRTFHKRNGQNSGGKRRLDSQDNRSTHKQFLWKANISVLAHPCYSPDLAPWHFYLLPKIKSTLKGSRFESIEKVKRKPVELMKSLLENDLQHCFQQWKLHMERCRDQGGHHIEGDNIVHV